MILSKTNVTRLLRFVKASVPCISEHCGVLWENCPTRCLFWLSTTREQRAVVWCFACSIQRRCLAQIVPWLHPQSVKVPRLSWLKGWVTVEACCYHGGDIADCKKTLGLPKYHFLQSLDLQGSLPFLGSSVVARFFSSLEPAWLSQERCAKGDRVSREVHLYHYQNTPLIR